MALISPPIRRGLIRAAVTATRGILTAAGAVQGTMATFRNKLDNSADEAKDEQDLPWEDIEQPTAEYIPGGHPDELPTSETSNEMFEPDSLEAGTVDIGSDSRKKRMHGKQR